MIKLVFFLIVFSLIPFAFAQLERDVVCEGLTDENPIIVYTDKKQYGDLDDKIIISICISPETYHKHMEMIIYDSNDSEVERMFDPGFIPGESLELEPYFFIQEISLDSFEKDDQYYVTVYASGLVGTAFFIYGDAIEELKEFLAESQRTDKSFFRTNQIESVIEDPSWSKSKPQDISKDGKNLLLLDFQNIAILNLDDGKIDLVDYGIEFHAGTNIKKAKFAQNSLNEIVFNFEDHLYKTDVTTGNAEKIIEDIEDFDLTSDYKVIFSTKGSNWTETDETFSLWISNQDGTEIVNLLENHKDVKYFDFSPDDSKIVYSKISYSEPFVNKFVMIYDLETKQFSEIPGLNMYCGGNPKWSPNSELIIYQYGNCDRHFPEASIHITDLDGNLGFIAEVDYLGTDFTPSNDGVFLYYNSVFDGVYKMTLAQPIPEFETIAMMVLALTIVPVLLLGKSRMSKLNI